MATLRWCYPSDPKERKYFRTAWWASRLENRELWASEAIIWLSVKLVGAAWVVCCQYRYLVVQYSESLADRGLVRCIVYVPWQVISCLRLRC